MNAAPQLAFQPDSQVPDAAPVLACLLCGLPRSAFVPWARLREWRYVTCSGCSSVFLDPCPSPRFLANYYNGAYEYNSAAYRESVRLQKDWLLGLLHPLASSPRRLLEVGCSYGHFLSAARNSGWQVSGVELDRRAAAFARTELGIPVPGGTISDLPPEPAFDAVAAWHVIEHLPDPLQFLREIEARLGPGGVLALRTPNVESVVARLAGPGWEWLSPPDHIWLFSLRTLSRMLEMAGLRVVFAETVRGNATNPWFEILRSRIRPHFPVAATGTELPRQPRFARSPWYRACKRAISVASGPLDWCVASTWRRNHREAELVVVARKPAPSDPVGLTC